MATGRSLLGIEPLRPSHVWYWNGEDPEDEIDRGFAAIIKHYRLKPKDIGSRLYRDSGRLLPIKIARTKNGTTQIAVPVVAEIKAAIKNNSIDVLIIDPFVASHAATENDNNAMELVAKQWAHIADETNCAIMLKRCRNSRLSCSPRI
jgi:RecA-family ATPase